MTYTVKITETHIGFLDFETKEEARAWMECPEDFKGVTWSEATIEGLEIVESVEEDWSSSLYEFWGNDEHDAYA